jgi:hydroxyacylglutathione hydrolase
MLISKLINQVFNSNTYILAKLEQSTVWVIDPGSSTTKLINWLENNEKHLAGILLTHTHFDHIYGLNDLQEKYPYVNVYASAFANEGMISEKINGSLYMEIPFTIKRPDYKIIKEKDKISLWEGTILNVIETPGHDRDCLTFQIEKNLFTGDALLPGIKVYTKLKYSDETQAKKSIERIFNYFTKDTLIWPGHNDMMLLGDINIDNLISCNIEPFRLK